MIQYIVRKTKGVLSKLKAAAKKILPFLRWTIVSLPEAIAFGFVVIVSMRIIQPGGADTTNITTGALAITLGLSALTFTYSSSITGNETLKANLVYAAERLFHASLLLIMVAILQYVLIIPVDTSVEDKISENKNLEMARNIYLYFIQGVLVFLFSMSVLFANTGFRYLNQTLYERFFKFVSQL